MDPLECPNCGAQMKIVGFIERDNPGLIKLFLSAAGLWREPAPRPPPPEPAVEPEAHDLVLDYPKCRIILRKNKWIGYNPSVQRIIIWVLYCCFSGKNILYMNIYILRAGD